MQTKVLEPMKKKMVHLSVVGKSALVSGEMVYVGENYVVLSTKKSCKHYVDADKIVDFFADEDKPVETAE
jgi:hypothetical protein